MAKFLYAYTGGGMAATDEERNAQMQKWEQWMSALGPALVDGGAPFGESRSVNGGGTAGLTGYSVVEAASIDEAVAHAKNCPIFATGGDVQVYEALAM